MLFAVLFGVLEVLVMVRAGCSGGAVGVMAQAHFCKIDGRMLGGSLGFGCCFAGATGTGAFVREWQGGKGHAVWVLVQLLFCGPRDGQVCFCEIDSKVLGRILVQVLF